MNSPKIAALVLTYNEEINIADCINSLNFTHKVYVFDSFSADNTITISKSLGAEVYQRTFDNYANQRNAALSIIPTEYSWILMIDADERITPELKDEIVKTLSTNPDKSLYRFRRKDFFLGKWIKRSSGYPTWFPRLFKNGNVTVIREINEEYHTYGIIDHLKGHLLHYPFNKGISWWFDRHNKYSTMEADKLIVETKFKFRLKQLFSYDSTIRRKAQKQLLYRIPFRPQIMFFLLYFVRMGFLDGRQGLIYCKLRKTYEWLIDLKVKEKQYQK